MTRAKRGAFDRLADAVGAIDGLVLRVGWLDPESAAIAHINEEGSRDGKRPPARPVLQPALDENADLISDLTAKATRDALAGRSPRGTLEELGRRLEDEVRTRIYSATPNNAPSTIRKKGYDAPLRGPEDRILDGVTSVVVEASTLSGDRDEG